MGEPKPTVVFFGNERIATAVTTEAPILQALLNAGYPVAAVVSHYEPTKSRASRDLEIAAVAAKHNIPVLLPDKPSEISQQLVDYHAEAAVLVAYGKIVPQSVIDIFPRGIINIHPSLLPLHRGPIPLESVILEGAAETGVSIMQLAKEMDAGPVYGQVVHPLSGTETKQSLADNLLHMGKDLLMQLLPAILDGSLHPAPQKDAEATYDARLTKEDGLLDFTKPARLLEREIRAFAGWPGSRTVVADKEITITAAHCEPATNGPTGTIWLDSTVKSKQFGFHTPDGILVVDTLKPSGKPEMSAQAFLAGYGFLIQPN